MICLLKNVYLTYAETSVGPENVENLPPEYIQIIDKGLEYIEHVAYNKIRLYYQRNLSSILDAVPEQEFILELARKESEVYIYADENAFAEFFIRWFKGLYPKASVDTIHKLWMNYRSYEWMITNKRKTYMDIGVDSKPIGFRDFASLYWDKSLEEFKGLYELYPAFKIPLEAKLSCAPEHQLLQHKIGNGQLFATGIFKLSKTLYEERFMSEFGGLMRMISRNILMFGEKFESLKPFISFRHENFIEILSQNKDLAFLSDLKITPDIYGFEYLKNNYNVKELASKLLDMDYELNKSFGLTAEAVQLDNPVLSYFVKNNKHPPIMDVLEMELNNKSPFQLFKHLVQNNKFNIFILHAAHNLSTLPEREAKELRDELIIDLEES